MVCKRRLILELLSYANRILYMLNTVDNDYEMEGFILSV